MIVTDLFNRTERVSTPRILRSRGWFRESKVATITITVETVEERLLEYSETLNGSMVVFNPYMISF
jgi:hypothetical protein